MKINKLIDIENAQCFTLEEQTDKRSVAYPEKYGVYIVTDDKDDVIYIGMSGIMNNDGTFKGQNIQRRLNNTHKIEHKKLINEKGYLYIKIYCIPIQDGELPSCKEACLLEKFYGYDKRLPLLNEKA